MVRNITIGLLALQFLPYLLLWDQAYIRIHDTLEGIDYQLLLHAGKIFDYDTASQVGQILNGQPRMAMKTGWSFIALWHWQFGVYGGYIFNYIVVHLTAFAGMYLLLRQHVFKNSTHQAIILGTALCFSWIPVFSMLGLSVAGQPLLAWAFLNILGKNADENKWKPAASWFAISIFPFYSDIVWAGLPVLLFAAGYLLFDFIKTSQWNWRFFTACVLLAVLYFVANWQLFQITFFTPEFISHRTAYNYFYNKSLTLWQSLLDTLRVFFVSHHHIGIFISVPVFIAAVWDWRRPGRDSRIGKTLTILVVISLFYGFYNWLVWLGGDYFVLIKSFKFERVIVLMPVLWGVLLAVSLSYLTKYKRMAVGLLAVQFLLCVLANDEFIHNLRQIAGKPQKPNFEAFFDKKLFDEVSRQIPQPKESFRVISLGMHPSVAQYNGFFTLDAHQSLYSLDYKHRFRQIMAKELAKNLVIRNEFDHFGNRCYLYSAELGKEYDAYLCGKKNNRKIQHLDLDTEALCGLGGCYLFSAVEILNAPGAGLHLQGVFEGRFWRLHLYEVIGQPIVLKD